MADMLRVFRCNLHTHTCLSPCGDLDMYPSALVRACLASHLDLVAVTDHNSGENVGYVQEAARNTGLVVIPGMEVTSREEVHLLTLFEDTLALEELQGLVYRNLPGLNDEDVFGVQAVVNAQDEVEGLNERLLIGATGLGLEELEQRVHALGGLVFAAHIDRPSFSVLSQLGFMPPGVKFDALEISSRLEIREARRRYPELASYPFVTSSDAHYLQDLGSACTRIRMREPSFQELRMALARREGRGIME